jgi:hypothetical protein
VTGAASSGAGYAGQLGLSDAATDFNKHDSQIWRVLAKVRTVVPVKVMAVHVDSDGLAPVGFVDAQPAVNQMDGAGNTYPHDTVYSLPYFRLQGGTNAVICDPQVGDIGAALICDRDISSVKANKGIANPGSRRRFSLPDGLYLGGFLNGTPTQYFRFTANGIEIVDANGNTVTTTPSGIQIVDKSGNTVSMAAGGVTVTDDDGNVIATSSSGITLTPKSGEPVMVDGPQTVTGSSLVDGNLVIGGSVQIEGGTPITRVLTGNGSPTWLSFGPGGERTATITVTGAKPGDGVVLGLGGEITAGLVCFAYVSSDDTVTIVVQNPSAGTHTQPTIAFNVIVIGTS